MATCHDTVDKASAVALGLSVHPPQPSCGHVADSQFKIRGVLFELIWSATCQSFLLLGHGILSTEEQKWPCQVTKSQSNTYASWGSTEEWPHSELYEEHHRSSMVKLGNTSLSLWELFHTETFRLGWPHSDAFQGASHLQRCLRQVQRPSLFQPAHELTHWHL